MFVTLEGIDRSGKTTQTALLAEALGPDTVVLREPGGTEAGERIRTLLKDPGLELGPESELLLFAAARAELCAQVVAEARAAGNDVVCDRFIDSTVAYQGVARGLGVELVERINALAVGEQMPDLTIYLRIDPKEAERRGQQRLAAGEADGQDRFEAEGIAFQERVARAYDEIAERAPERVEVVDSAGTPEQVHGRVVAAIEARLNPSVR